MFTFFKQKKPITIETFNAVLTKLDQDINYDTLVDLYEKDRGRSNQKEYYLQDKGRDALINFLTGVILYQKNKVVVFDWKDEVRFPENKGYKYVEFESESDTRNFYIVKENVIFSPEESQLLKILNT